MSSSTKPLKWGRDGTAYRGDGYWSDDWCAVCNVSSSVITSTFWMYPRDGSPNVDLQTQDYAAAKRIAETIIRLEGAL